MRERELEVVDVEIQPCEHDSDGGIERIAGCDGDIVRGGDGAVESRVRAADVRDGFGVELGFDAGLAEDEDGAAVRGQGEDAGDVDCGAVGGAEDFVLRGGVSEGASDRARSWPGRTYH